MLPTPYLYCIVEILNWQFVVNFRLFFWFLFHPLETLPHLFADFTFYHALHGLNVLTTPLIGCLQ